MALLCDNVALRRLSQRLFAASPDGVRAFLQGNLDYLAIGDFLVEHPSSRR